MKLFLLLVAVVAGRILQTLSRRRRRAFVDVPPDWRRCLRELGLTEARHFLDLPGLIVSGHPDRHVARVHLGRGPGALTAYIKREHRVPWAVRLVNALAGFGLSSRSLREARTLQALAREGLGAPAWLAAGEDGRGRAFLLVREVPGAELRAYLHEEGEPARRLAVAQRLGTMLSRLHDAGFEHPDLYAKHVLVDPKSGAVHLLDWLRARRRRALGWRARGRGLAALQATLDARLATGAERRACLRAYLGAAQQHPEEAVTPGRPLPPAAPRRAARLRLVMEGLRAHLGRLLARRHVREKRQLPGPAQAWTCLAGEALCITPALDECCPAGVPDWLPLEAQPSPTEGPLSRRWFDLPGGRRLLLVRCQYRVGWQAHWRPMCRRPWISAEQCQASLLLRLERHGVAAPRVLALGRRAGPAEQVESFLLTEPPSDTIGLQVWLRGSGRSPTWRREVLRQTGLLLGRLHEAACDFAGSETLAVQLKAGQCPTVVVENVERVRTHRRRAARREEGGLLRLQRLLAEAGCTRTELRCFRAGYRQACSAAVHRPPSPRPAALAARKLPTPTNPETLWQRLTRGVRRLRQRADWPVLAGDDWPDHVLDVAVTDHFHAKQGRSTGRWVLPARDGPSRTVYLKRHYRLPWWQGVLATLWPRVGWSPALEEWRHLEWARRQGVPVPEVVAAAEYIGPWGRLQSLLAVEELAGMISLDQAIPQAAARLDPPTFRRWKRSLAAEMARLARMLHDRRVFHKDMYLCHFFIAEADVEDLPAAGWQGRVYLIDLHRLAHHPWTWWLWQLKDLAQLIYSSEITGIDARDRLWFWHAYRGSGPRRGGGRWLRRGVWLKWQSYRRHNTRKNRP
jgi:heptose I phosphotransferase